MAYIKSAREEEECIFCTKAQRENDEDELVLKRGKHAMVLMNAYPYNNGHLMISPYRHVASLEDLNRDEQLEIIALVVLSMSVIRRALNAEGFNVGANIGSVSGAGIAEHVHMHIVPRWKGDTSFMTVIADTKVMPESLVETYRKLRTALHELESH